MGADLNPTLSTTARVRGANEHLRLAYLAVWFGERWRLDQRRRSDRVFSSDELTRDLPCPLLERLSCQEDDQPMVAWHAPIQLLADGPLAGQRSVALIPVGAIAPAALDFFATRLREALGENKELVISTDLLATRACNTQVLVTAPGAAKREQLRQLRDQLALQGSPVAGWVMLEV